MARKSSPLDEDDAGMDMSPMIDMVFLLLVFFLVNANLISVKIDKEVETPAGSNSKAQSDASGRIVINIRKDGKLYDEDVNLLASEKELSDYIKERKEFFEGKEEKPRLHLRGHDTAIFKYTYKVMGAAGKQGLSEVMFAVVEPE